MREKITKAAAIRVAQKRLPILSERKLLENLEPWASLADAYRVGAEEAQQEIVARLHALRPEVSRG